MGSLSGQYISQSFVSLIHLGSDTTITSSFTTLQDGLGNSLNVSVNALGDISASGNIYAANLNALTSSALITASATSNVITFTKGNGSTFNVTVADLTDLSSLNAFTASQNTKNATLASYTGSNDTKWSNLGAQSGSWITESETGNFVTTSSFNQYTSSNDSKVNQLINATGSYAISSSVAAIDAAQQLQINSLINATASYANSASVATVDYNQQQQINSLIAATASFQTSSTDITSLNAFTASQEIKDTTLANVTSSLNQFTQSQSNLNLTFATTGSNTFNGDQIINGNISAVSGTFQYIHTIFETASVIYSSGSNQFGDELTDIQTLSGSVRVQGSLTINGTPVQTSSVDISFLNAFTASQETKDSTLATYTASVDTKFATIGGLTGSYATTGSNNFVGNQTLTGSLLISSSATNDLIVSGTMALIGGTLRITSSTGAVGAYALQSVSLNSGSMSNAVMNRTVGIYHTSGSSQIGLTAGTTTLGLGPSIFASSDSSFTNYEAIKFQDGGNYTDGRVTFPTPVVLQQALTASLTEGYTWVGGVGNISQLVSTSSFGSPTDLSSLNAFTASQETKNSTLATYTASVDSQLSSLTNATASYAISSSVAAVDAGQQSQIDNLIAWTSSVVPTNISSLNAFTASQETKNSTLATYTASVDSSLTNINSFTASNGNTSLNSYTASNDTKWSNLAGQTGSYVTSAITASSLVTASVNLNTITFTKGDASTFNIIVNTGSAVTTDITSLNAFTASQETKNSTLASYTASVDISLSNINSFTSSQDTKNSTLATYTASVDQKFSNIGSQSGSWITESETGSFARTNVDNNFSVNQTFTNITAVSASFTYVQTTYETSSIIYSSGSNQFGDELSDIQTLSGSVKVQGSLTVNGTPVQTSSVDITSLNAFTASQETKNTTLASVTSSLNSATASLFTSTSLSLTTASVSGQTMTFTKGDGTTFNVLIPTASFFTSSISVSGSITISGSIENVDYIDFNTASATPAWQSGRVFWDNTDGCLAVYNVEQDVTLQVGQENWTRVWNGTGLTIANGAAVRLSGTHGDVPEVVLAQSIAISGSANITNQILGLATHTIETGTYGFITTQGLVRGLNTSAFTDGATLYVSQSAGLLSTTPPPTPYEKIPIGQCVKASPGGSGIIYVAVEQPIDFSDLSSVTVGTYTNGDMWYYSGSGVNGAWSHRSIDQIGLTTTSSFNAYTSSTNDRLNNLETTTASLNLFTASVDTKFTTIGALTGSYATTGSNNFIGNQRITGSLIISSSAAVDLQVTGAIGASGNIQSSGSNGQSQLSNVALSITSNSQTSSATYGRNVMTQRSGSNVVGMSANPEQGNYIAGLTNPSIFTLSGSWDTDGVYYAPIQFQKGLEYTDGRVTITTPLKLNSVLTASLTEGYVWAGGAGNITKLVATSSFGGGTTFPYTGTASISGALQITGSAPTILSSSYNGTLITNLTDTYTDVPAVNQIVTLTSASYAALTTGSLINQNTLYIVSGSASNNYATTGSNSFVGSQTISGSLTITGSAYGNVVSMSITSNTASMDLSQGNYFTLSLPSGSTTRISPTGIAAGVGATLVITTLSGSLVTFDSSVKQPSGSAYVPSSGSTDILSFVSVNTTNLYVVASKNMI